MNARTIKPRRMRAAVITLVTILLAAGLILITPQGQAWAQSLLRFFTRSQSSTLPVPTQAPVVFVALTPGITTAPPTPKPTLSGAAFSETCGDFRSPRCSLAQIRAKVNFTVKELGVLPAGVTFGGATGGPDEVVLQYITPDHSTAIVLTEKPWTGSAARPILWNDISPNAVVEALKIGTQDGEYVKGSYGYRSGETQATWNDNAGMQDLRWVEDGIFMAIQRLGPDGLFDQKEMVALAESLTSSALNAKPNLTPTTTPTLLSPTPEPGYQFILSAAEAGQKAGFRVQQPTRLPEGYTIKGFSYDPVSHFVGIQIIYGDPDTPDGAYGLMIREELAPQAAQCNLCAFKPGDERKPETQDPYVSLAPKNSIVTVQVNGAAGYYVEGMWHNISEWDPDPYVKRLRWQAKGIAYELFNAGNDVITKEVMITIAESMK